MERATVWVFFCFGIFFTPLSGRCGTGPGFHLRGKAQAMKGRRVFPVIPMLPGVQDCVIVQPVPQQIGNMFAVGAASQGHAASPLFILSAPAALLPGAVFAARRDMQAAECGMLLNRHLDPIHRNGIKLQSSQPTPGKQNLFFLPVQQKDRACIETTDGKQGESGKQKAARADQGRLMAF